jgi:sodium-dependent dicarboxylate transporter 2/3/5
MAAVASARPAAAIGRVAGPVLAVVVYLVVPAEATTTTGEVIELGQAGRATAAVAVLMAVWWMTEAIAIPATALVPLVAFPLLGVGPIEEVAPPYANPLIFLFLGGFLLAAAMARWGVERRIALVVLGVVGSEPARLVAGFMVVTALLSMWVSNTATAAMMLPVALSVVAAATTGGDHDPASGPPPVPGEGEPGRRFATALLLGIAFAASIGGVATLIGSPPNLFLASYSAEELGQNIGFAQWMLIGLPFTVIMLPVAWVLLVRVLFRPDVAPDGIALVIARWRSSLGPLRRSERRVMVVFGATVTAWITRPLLAGIRIGNTEPFAELTDAGIALAAAVALFVLPAGEDRRRLLTWSDTRNVPWGTLLLFGGGLSLAAAIDRTGVAELIGSVASSLGGLPPVVVVAVVVAIVVFLTELTSNTATVAALLPILAAAAAGLGLDPLTLAVPTALAGSLAFMLPVATPPNAVVFGSGHVAMRDMVRTGARLNLVSIVVVTVLTFVVAAPVLGLGSPW